jgi:hypothetical protein
MLLLSIKKEFIELTLIMKTFTRLSSIPAAESKGCANSFIIASTSLSLSLIILTQKEPLQYIKKNNRAKNLAIFGRVDSVHGIKRQDICSISSVNPLPLSL